MSEFPHDPPPPPYEPPLAHDEFAGGDEPPMPPHSDELAPLPFEDPNIPAFSGLIETVVLFVRKPHEAFARMRTEGNLLRPVVYGLVLASIGVLVGALLNIVVDKWVEMLPKSVETQRTTMPAAFWLAYAACGPLLVAIGIFIRALILHLCLMIVGGASRGLGATFRALCYAQTYAVAMLVPICGWFAAGFWGVFLEIVGVKVAHRTTYGRAITAYLIPTLLVCACLIFVFMMFGTAIMASMKNLPH